MLNAANAQAIFRSQRYETKASALTGLASVQTRSLRDQCIELKVASDGRPIFNQKAGNGQIVGASQS